ncbi:alpha-galactosidase D [Streptomyces sp. C10-9-1]|uniref:alpha-galactosidase D n=1 Tax=Streptomyces sp. C10-9-1 TaxID=1859285 RepID=UPI003D73D2C7
MGSTAHAALPRRVAGALVVLALTAGTITAASLVPAATESPGEPARPALLDTTPALAAKPYMGWSSWSMQTSKYPGLNPEGRHSYLTEANVLKQADAMASKLKDYGYEYINIDSGWWRTMDWERPAFDSYGRRKADPVRFPRGMKAVADDIHAKGLKAGIYVPVGLDKLAYGGGDVPIWNAGDCTTADIVYDDLRSTNGWDNAYKIDFSDPCAQKYVDSQARQFADWGYDFLKFDGVGPGSGRRGANYNNVPDVAAWKKAIAATGRPIHLELSWALDYGHVEDWKKHSNGWRVGTDVECYCGTLVTWTNSVDDRFDDVPPWTRHAGPGGWNDLDALNVGNGEMDGLTQAERRSYATLWAIAKSPLYIGDDLTRLDAYGLSLLTNREVIAVNQGASPPAQPVTPSDPQQVWAARNVDGTYTVALFNLSGSPADVTAHWATLGFTGEAGVRDLWLREDLGRHRDKITRTLPAHGSHLFTVTPYGEPLDHTRVEAESPINTLGGRASARGCSGCSDGRMVGNLYWGGNLTFNKIVVDSAGTYQIKVTYISGDARTAEISVGGGATTRHKFPATGDWRTLSSVHVPVVLKAGENTITFDSGTTGYAPDIDRIDIPRP